MTATEAKAYIKQGIGGPANVQLPPDFSDGLCAFADQLGALPIDPHHSSALLTAVVGVAQTVGNNLRNVETIKAA
jgi:hypothetical protein